MTHITKSGSTEKGDSIAFEYTKQYNSPNSTHIVVSKTVQGTAGNVNETFNFTANVSGSSGTSYVVRNTVTGASSSCAASTNCTFTLKSGQSVTIGLNGTTEQIPIGTTFTIAETGATDYETYINGEVDDDKTTDTRTANINIDQNTFDFINKKDGEVATGIALSVLPYVLLAGISVGLIIYSRKTIAR